MGGIAGGVGCAPKANGGGDANGTFAGAGSFVGAYGFLAVRGEVAAVGGAPKFGTPACEGCSVPGGGAYFVVGVGFGDGTC